MISGDLVEHATEAGFHEARQWIDRLPQPRLVVPGNHDLAFYDPWRRFRDGLRDYRRMITDNLEPTYLDQEIAVMGTDTPRIFPPKGGRISARQIARVQEEVCGLGEHVVKILVTHHPLDLPEKFRRNHLVRKASRAVTTLSSCVDLLIAGHIHLSSTGATAARYKTSGSSVIFAQAGTVISRRNKGEPNSFNVIRVTRDEIGIQHRTWDQETACFRGKAWERFVRGAKGWSKVEDGALETVVLE